VKKWIEQYKQMRSNPKGKAILFFGFYFVFFAVLIALLRFSEPVSSYDNDSSENTLAFDVSSLQQSHHFHYVVTVDNDSYVYDGVKDGIQEQFTFQNKNYYYDGSTYFIHSDEWVKSENPYLYSAFFNSNNIIELLQKAYFESETTYKSGKVTYHFSLDTNLIYQFLFLQNTDFDGQENSIIVSMNENGEIGSIIWELNDYCKSREDCQKTLKLELEYDQIGEIEEIKNPIEIE
jgi:hypothetical protein